MTRRKLLSILQEETDGFKERSRLRDDVLDAMEQAYIKGKKEQLTLTDVSQQRELLLAYHRYLTKELSLDLNELWVDEHLKANKNK
jgi:hypothetical protein